MSAPDALYVLHERLINDRAIAFRSLGTGESVRQTPAGRAWHHAYRQYLIAWGELERQGYDVVVLLRNRYGYISDAEIGAEPDPEPIPWHEDQLKEGT